jgi:hypothetical protein
VETKGNVFLCYEHYCLKEAKQRNHTINMQPRKKRIHKGLPIKSFKGGGIDG